VAHDEARAIPGAWQEFGGMHRCSDIGLEYIAVLNRPCSMEIVRSMKITVVERGGKFPGESHAVD
jgi:hypothetical protein